MNCKRGKGKKKTVKGQVTSPQIGSVRVRKGQNGHFPGLYFSGQSGRLGYSHENTFQFFTSSTGVWGESTTPTSSSPTRKLSVIGGTIRSLFSQDKPSLAGISPLLSFACQPGPGAGRRYIRDRKQDPSEGPRSGQVRGKPNSSSPAAQLPD